MRPEHIGLAHALEGLPGNILIALILHAAPTQTRELARQMRLSAGRAETGLQFLADLGLVDPGRTGWAVSEAARLMFQDRLSGGLGMPGQIWKPEPEERRMEEDLVSGGLEPGPAGRSAPACAAEDQRDETRPPGEKASDQPNQVSLKLTTVEDEPRKNDASAVKGVNLKLLKDQLTTTDSLTNLDALPAVGMEPDGDQGPEPEPPSGDAHPETEAREAGPQPDLDRVLRAARSLFGEPVLRPSGTALDPDRVVAWIAQAHDQRAGIRKPARVVYANLKANRAPPDQYLDDPFAYLPEAFLVRAGLIPEPDAEAAGGLDGEEEPDLAFSLPDEAEMEVVRRRRTLSEYVHPASMVTARAAWQQALLDVQHVFPSRRYRNTLEAAELDHFDLDNCLFTVLLDSEIQKTWLEAEIQPSLHRYLTGVCNREARVQFVVCPEN